MEARWARAHDTSISVPSTSVEDPDPTRILGKQGSAGKLSVATSKFGSRQIGKLFQPVVEALACDEDLGSSGWENVRHPSNRTSYVAGYPRTAHLGAGARTGSGKCDQR